MLRRAPRRLPASPPRGVLRAAPPGGGNEHLRVLPPEELAPFLAHFWSVRWALRDPVTAETLPHPSVHVVLEEQGGARRAEIGGVHSARYVRRLEGTGRVFAIKFRPAMFQPLLGKTMASLANRVVRVRDVFGPDGDAWAAAVFDEEDLDARIALASAFLVARLPPAPPELVRLRDLVERMAVDRTLLRVEQVADAVGLDVRALQRSFRRAVGATPKWVLQRYRLHEAAEQLKGPRSVALATLAASLGYADQAHFARDFKQTIGRTPRAFAAEHAAKVDARP